MATVNRHEFLFSTNLKYFKALQLIGSKSIFDRYKIAKVSIIDKYIAREYQNFLAYPVKDGDKIEFHGIKAKNDNPQILSDLQNDVAIKYQNIKNETIQHYHDIINNLKNSDKVTEAKFLIDAIKIVDDRFVFCYDDKVVLGAWGMQIRSNVHESINVIRLKVPKRKQKLQQDSEIPEIVAPVGETSELPQINPFTIRFNSGENGNLNGQTEFTKYDGDFIIESEIPKATPSEGYEFIGWDENPNGYSISADKEFTAQYRKIDTPIPQEKIPWWKRFWLWLAALLNGSGCLKWLFRVLLFLLLLLLLLFLLKRYHDDSRSVDGTPTIDMPHNPEQGDNDSGKDNNNPEQGDNDPGKDNNDPGKDNGIYDPQDPYTPKPTPPDYKDILPPQQGVLPPMEENPEIRPGNPSIIANRLNILMDNEDKSIMDLAKEFKTKYPDTKYKVVYYDDVVKRMQIEIPKEEREKLKQEIPTAFAPEYELFIFDEALFEGRYKPNDPALKDSDKSWYLKAIHAPKAWDITRGSEKIIVAIVDNGFNLKHPELSNKVVKPYNVWLHSKKIFPQKIDHGTHVAGTALAIADNGKGLCGIAPNCKFMPIQVANKQEQMTTTSVLDGILYAIYQGADVINVSLGSMFKGLDKYNEAVQKDMIKSHFKEEERLWRHVMRIAANHNSTIVIAAGNDNVLAGIDAMQRPELFITVSAVDKKNQAYNKANFSNYGKYSDISAPGVGIYSSVGENRYQKMSGTSMAAPIVTGAVALMKSLNDSITNKRILCILQSTGLETQGEIGKLLQLDKALQKVKSGEVVDCTPAPSTGDVQVLMSWDNYNDLDLFVTDPEGKMVSFKNRHVASGGQLEIDMNVEYPDSKTPIENIYWPTGKAPNGTYNVYIKYYKQHDNIEETPYRITVKYGTKKDAYTGIIKKVKDGTHVCSFTLGNASNEQNPPNVDPNSPNTPPANDHQSQLEQERNRLQQELDRVNDELRRIKKVNK